jgi:molybdopterin-biosynthesis enzyme MoeA-like protein
MAEFYADARRPSTTPRLRDGARCPEGRTVAEPLLGAQRYPCRNIYILAGVPRIAAMMLDALDGQLEGGRPLMSRTLGGWIMESEVAPCSRDVERAQPSLPDRQLPLSSGTAAPEPIS